MAGSPRTGAGLSLWLCLGLGLLMGGCGSTMSQLSTEIQEGYRAQRAYQEGLDQYNARDYAGAIPSFQRALQLQPSLDDAEAYLAWSYYHAGDYPQATRHFRQVIARRPEWEGLHNGLGWSRYRVGRYNLAAEAFQKALELDPRYREAAVGLAYSLFELGRYAEALPYLDRLVREGEGYSTQTPLKDVEEVRSHLAWSLFYLGEYEKARHQFEKGLAARPNWYGLHNGLGWTDLRLGDKARAQESFGRALQLKPDYGDAKEGLAQVKR